MSDILNRQYYNSLGDFFAGIFQTKTQKINNADAIQLQQEQIESTNLIQSAYVTEAAKTNQTDFSTYKIIGGVSIGLVLLTIFFTKK